MVMKIMVLVFCNSFINSVNNWVVKVYCNW